MNISIGIDPGQKGAVAILGQDSGPDCFPMPLAGKEIDVARLVDVLLALTGPGRRIVVTMEKAQAMPQQGVSSTFTYAEGYGMVRGAIAGLGLQLELVRPTSWKAVVLSGTAKDKPAAISYVRRAFPAVNLFATVRSRVPHDGIADAVCLAEFGLRTYFSQAATPELETGPLFAEAV